MWCCVFRQTDMPTKKNTLLAGVTGLCEAKIFEGWISLIKWGSVIFFFFLVVIGFKDKLSLACTQQVCIYMRGEDLLSSSIALCRHKQEKQKQNRNKKETWSRQMNYYNIR